MEWTSVEIKAILETPEGVTGKLQNRYIIYRMLQAMFDRQTLSEQQSKNTHNNNGVGFNGADAPILSDIAEKSRKYKNLTPKQATLVGRKLRKYIRQLTEIAAENAPKKQAKLYCAYCGNYGHNVDGCEAFAGDELEKFEQHEAEKAHMAGLGTW